MTEYAGYHNANPNARAAKRNLQRNLEGGTNHLPARNMQEKLLTLGAPAPAPTVAADRSPVSLETAVV